VDFLPHLAHGGDLEGSGPTLGTGPGDDRIVSVWHPTTKSPSVSRPKTIQHIKDRRVRKQAFEGDGLSHLWVRLRIRG